MNIRDYYNITTNRSAKKVNIVQLFVNIKYGFQTVCMYSLNEKRFKQTNKSDASIVYDVTVTDEKFSIADATLGI